VNAQVGDVCGPAFSHWVEVPQRAKRQPASALRLTYLTPLSTLPLVSALGLARARRETVVACEIPEHRTPQHLVFAAAQDEVARIIERQLIVTPPNHMAGPAGADCAGPDDAGELAQGFRSRAIRYRRLNKESASKSPLGQTMPIRRNNFIKEPVAL
jgi:hypothetical protein